MPIDIDDGLLPSSKEVRAAKNTKKFDLPDPIAVTASPEYDALAWRERQASIVDDRRDQSTAKASAMVLKAAAQSPSAGRPRGSRRRAAPRAEAGPPRYASAFLPRDRYLQVEGLSSTK